MKYKRELYMGEKRLSWLDNVKMVAMICVMVGHVGSLFANGFPAFLLGLIVAFNMPLFMLLAGYTSLCGLFRIVSYKDLLYYAEKVLWRMVIPAVALSAIDQACRGLLFARKLWIIYALITGVIWFINNTITNNTKFNKCVFIVKNILVAFLLISSLKLNMFWFLVVLMELQLIAAVLYWGAKSFIPQRYIIFVVGLCVWIGSYFALGGWTFEMSIYFALGMLLNQKGFFTIILKMSFWKSMTAFLSGYALFRFCVINYCFYDNPIQSLVPNGLAYIYFLRVFTSLLLSFAIIRWIYAMSGIYTWFSKMGSYTMSFYTIHVLIIELLLKPNLYFENPNSYMWFCGLGSVLGLTIVTYLIIYTCEQSILTKGIILGKWEKI